LFDQGSLGILKTSKAREPRRETSTQENRSAMTIHSRPSKLSPVREVEEDSKMAKHNISRESPNSRMKEMEVVDQILKNLRGLGRKEGSWNAIDTEEIEQDKTILNEVDSQEFIDGYLRDRDTESQSTQRSK
jgi:hypothetical protein